MAKHFLSYWKPSTVDNDGRSALMHSASNQYGRVDIGDTVWIVTLREGELELYGKLVVAKVCDQITAAIELKSDDLWDASHHIIAKNGGLYPVKMNIQKLAQKVRFNSATGKTKLELVEGETNPAQLQTMRELTFESGQMLEKAFQEACKKLKGKKK
jgi:hypothetical protein